MTRGFLQWLTDTTGTRMRLTLNAAEENPMRWLRVLICSVLITGMEFAAAVGLARPAFAAVLECPSGDVACLIAAINTANANGEVNTIRLAAGAYTLAAADNDADGHQELCGVEFRGRLLTGIEGVEHAPSRLRKSRLLLSNVYCCDHFWMSLSDVRRRAVVLETVASAGWPALQLFW